MKTYGEVMQEAVEAFGEALQKFAEEWDRFVINLRDDAPVYIEFCTKCNQHTRTRAEIVDRQDCMGFMLRCTECGAWARQRVVYIEPDYVERRGYCSACKKDTRTVAKDEGNLVQKIVVDRCYECGKRKKPPLGIQNYDEFCQDCHRITKTIVISRHDGIAKHAMTLSRRCMECDTLRPGDPNAHAFCTKCLIVTYTLTTGEAGVGLGVVDRCGKCGTLRKYFGRSIHNG